MKRLAARASLRRPTEDQILTLFQLYEWASQTIPSIPFAYTVPLKNTKGKKLTLRFDFKIVALYLEGILYQAYQKMNG